MERQTHQKKIILDYLKSTCCHPSSETVYSEVKQELPNISRGTVYRILKSLKEKKEIQEIPTQVSRYDGDVTSHAHFVCERCNEIFDIFEACQECKILKRKKTKVGEIKNYQIHFYGVCKKCRRQKAEMP